MSRWAIGTGVVFLAVGLTALLAGCQQWASVPTDDKTGPVVSNDSQRDEQGTSSALQEITLEVTGMS